MKSTQARLTHKEGAPNTGLLERISKKRARLPQAVENSIAVRCLGRPRRIRHRHPRGSDRGQDAAGVGCNERAAFNDDTV